MVDDRGISTLNTLIRTCEDGAAGFETPTEEVKDSSVTTLAPRNAYRPCGGHGSNVRSIGFQLTP